MPILYQTPAKFNLTIHSYENNFNKYVG